MTTGGKKGGTKGFVAVTITPDGFDELTNDLLQTLKGPKRIEGIKFATMAALDAVKDYYAIDMGRDGWVNPRLMTHGPGRRPTQWWRGTVNGWKMQEVKRTSSVLANKTIGLSHKVTGGTIRPVRAKALTIPISEDAHGLSARQYARSVAPLFRIGLWTGNPMLVRNTRTGAENPAWSDSGIKPVFRLMKSVTHKPWPGALPDVADYMEPFETSILDYAEDQIRGMKYKKGH